MNLSSYIFGLILATLLAAIFHLWRDGGFWKLMIYIGLSWVGFFVGNWAAGSAGIKILVVGPVYLGGGILGSIIFLFLGHWILQVKPGPQE